MSYLATLAEILDAAAARARELDAADRAERRDWTDQASSPLGRRRHVAAVRRRVAAGDDGAAMIGRRALLNDCALSEEMAATRPKAKRPEGTGERIRARLGLVAGGAR